MGVDRAHYTSAENAADVEDLRKALGYPAWNLYGISYGSRLALTVMRDHPGGVRSATLDSVYPPNVDAYADQAPNAERAFEQLFSSCERETTCAASYPGLRQAFQDTVGRLDAERPTIEVDPGDGRSSTVELDGDALIGFVFDTLYDTDAIPGLPAAIMRVSRGDHAVLRPYVLEEDPVVPRRVAFETNEVAEGMELSVQCGEEAPFAAPEPGTPSRNARPFGIGTVRGACAIWDVPVAPAIEQEAVTSAIPTLLLAGDFDPITPPAWAESAARTLSRSTVSRSAASDTASSGTSGCADGLVSAFLLTPTTPPSARCTETLPGVTFLPVQGG
jgi:pimeloyl-ACP methyl ester carboxylesterase